MSEGVAAKFIVCEDVRTETNGKLTLTGVYPGEVIVLNKPPADTKPHPKWLAILPRIAFVGFIRGVPGGRLDGRSQVTSPSGEVIMMADLREVSFEDARPSTLILQGGAVGIPELGTYKAEFRIGDYAFAMDIHILGGPGFQALPRSKTLAKKAEKKALAKAVTKAGKSARKTMAR